MPSKNVGSVRTEIAAAPAARTRARAPPDCIARAECPSRESGACTPRSLCAAARPATRRWTASACSNSRPRGLSLLAACKHCGRCRGLRAPRRPGASRPRSWPADPARHACAHRATAVSPALEIATSFSSVARRGRCRSHQPPRRGLPPPWAHWPATSSAAAAFSSTMSRAAPCSPSRIARAIARVVGGIAAAEVGGRRLWQAEIRRVDVERVDRAAAALRHLRVAGRGDLVQAVRAVDDPGALGPEQRQRRARPAR